MNDKVVQKVLLCKARKHITFVCINVMILMCIVFTVFMAAIVEQVRVSLL